MTTVDFITALFCEVDELRIPRESWFMAEWH
jgi:hypothetical protein